METNTQPKHAAFDFNRATFESRVEGHEEFKDFIQNHIFPVFHAEATCFIPIAKVVLIDKTVTPKGAQVVMKLEDFFKDYSQRKGVKEQAFNTIGAGDEVAVFTSTIALLITEQVQPEQSVLVGVARYKSGHCGEVYNITDLNPKLEEFV